jgi:hypothetical protein
MKVWNMFRILDGKKKTLGSVNEYNQICLLVLNKFIRIQWLINQHVGSMAKYTTGESAQEP